MEEKHYQVGKKYVVDGTARECMGYSGCIYKGGDGGTDNICKTCPGNSIWKDSKPRCGMRNGKRMFPEAPDKPMEKIKYWKVGSVYEDDKGVRWKCLG